MEESKSTFGDHFEDGIGIFFCLIAAAIVLFLVGACAYWTGGLSLLVVPLGVPGFPLAYAYFRTRRAKR